MLTTDLPVTEDRSARLIRQWCEAAGLPADECFPLDTDSAGEVLRCGGYIVDGDELRRLGGMEQVPRLELWDARDVINAACVLESRRQWLSGTAHDAKKHSTMQELDQLLAAGPEGIAILKKHFAKMDLRMALILLAEADSREVREKVLSMVFGLLAIASHDRGDHL